MFALDASACFAAWFLVVGCCAVLLDHHFRVSACCICC